MFTQNLFGKHSLTRLILTAACLLFSAGQLAAQERGQISGIVSEVNTGGFLAGATAEVEGSDYYAVADRSGRYLIRNIPAGNYTLVFRYTGYDEVRENVTVTQGAVATVNISMGSEIEELEAFEIQGTLGSRARAINAQKSSQNLVNVISADAFGQLPDKTIADAVKRLPGVSVEQDQGRGEARYVTIRGMNADFNAVSVNGQRVMVANFDGASRSVPLDVVSSKSAESIEVTKAVTPDMDGDGVGGAVNIKTRTIFDYDGRFATVEGSVGYNQLSDKYEGGYPHDGTPYEADFSYGQYLDPDQTMGFMLSGNYRNRPYVLQGVSTANFVPITDSFVPELEDVLIPGDLQLEEAFDNIEGAGLTFNFGYRPDEANTLNFSANYTLRDTNQGSNRVSLIYFPDIILEGDTSDVVNNTLTDFVSDDRVRRQVRDFYETQEVLNLVADGQHVRGDYTINWQLGWNRGDFKGDIDRDTSARFRSGFGDNGYSVDPADGYFPEPGDRLDNLTADDYDFEWVRRGTREILDNDVSGGFDVRKDMDIFNLAGFIQGGVKVTLRKRDFDDISRRWEVLDSDVIWTLDRVELASTGEQIFGSVVADYTAKDSVDGRYNFGLFIDPARVRAAQEALIAAGQRDGIDYISRRVDRDAGRGLVNSYESEENVYSGYLMGQVRHGNWTTLAGVRVEHTDVQFDGFEGDFFDLSSIQPITEENSYTDVLPGFHVLYSINQNSQLRASANSTLARPSYFQLNPSADIDPFGGALGNGLIVTGSTQLKPTRSWNFDLSYENYFGRFGFFSVGVFYKNMHDNVYRLSKTLAADDPEFLQYEDFGILPGAELRRFENAEGASVLGFEVAIEYPLEMLPSPMDGFSLFGNYTYTDSEVDFVEGTLPQRNNLETPLFGQVPSSWNLGFSYEKYGLECRLAYNVTDEYLLFNGIDENPDLDRYADQRQRLDLTAAYNITRSWKVFLEVQNALNSPVRAYRGDPNVRMYYNEFSGTSAFLGVRWRLN